MGGRPPAKRDPPFRHGVAPKDDPSEVELARLGGDEFTALIPNISQPEEALLVAHRIRELMHRPFVLDGREVVLTASIGIALSPAMARMRPACSSMRIPRCTTPRTRGGTIASSIAVR